MRSWDAGLARTVVGARASADVRSTLPTCILAASVLLGCHPRAAAPEASSLATRCQPPPATAFSADEGRTWEVNWVSTFTRSAP